MVVQNNTLKFIEEKRLTYLGNYKEKLISITIANLSLTGTRKRERLKISWKYEVNEAIEYRRRMNVQYSKEFVGDDIKLVREHLQAVLL